MAEQDQQVFFVDDELVERLLRGDAPVPSKRARPAVTPALTEAVQQAANGQLEEAANTLETAGEQGEDPAEVYSALGHVRFEQQRWEEAADCYAKAGNGPVHLCNLGLALARQGKFNEAEVSFEAASSDSKLWQARAGLGCCLLHTGQWHAAIGHFDVVLDKQPSHERSIFGKAVAFQHLGKLDDAWDLYRKLLPTNPDSEELITNMMAVSAARGDQTKTREYAEYLLKIRPGNKMALEVMAYVHANIGAALQQRGDNSGAVEEYEAALALSPPIPGVLWNLAIAAEQSRQWDHAEQYLIRLIQVAPDFGDASFRLGFLQLQRGDYSAAIDSLKACLEQRPDWTGALWNLGLACWKSEDLEAAVAAFERVRALDPSNTQASGALLAIAVERPALDTAWQLLECMHGDTGFEAVYNLGLALQRAGQHERAAKCYRKVIDLSPDFAPALLNLGHALEAMGLGPEARTTWARAVEMDKQLASGYFQ